jgi:nitroreductase
VDGVSEFDLAQTDRLLTTTKATSKRLDLGRPVPIPLVMECIKVASHAPIGGNREANRWLIIADPEVKKAVGEIYASVGRPYIEAGRDGVEPGTQRARVIESGTHLIDHLAEVPVLVIALRIGRVHEGVLGKESQSFYGSVIPAVWNFQLAARSRGLGTRYTTFTVQREADMAELLGIPEHVTQVALLPVAYYLGDTFTPARRLPVEEITFLDRWDNPTA